MTDGLRLKAETTEDLEVISACLQDALTHAGEMRFLPKSRRFAATFNRYKWEHDAAGEPSDGRNRFWRVRTGLHFDTVRSVQAYAMPSAGSQLVLELLSITAMAQDDGVEIALVFAGGGEMRLTCECIDAHLSDIGAPWPAKRRPEHSVL
jgi:hypothetical protein